MSNVLSGLHYLLATPFRYQPLNYGSRFRGPNDPGVFYCAESALTAGIELGYWRWRFLNDSEGIEEIEPVTHSAFSVDLKASTVDLRKMPFLEDESQWCDSRDYSATQDFANSVRKKDVGVILYQSVRNSEPSWCAAVLRTNVFAKTKPVGPMQTWLLKVNQSHLILRSDVESAQVSTESW